MCFCDVLIYMSMYIFQNSLFTLELLCSSLWRYDFVLHRDESKAGKNRVRNGRLNMNILIERKVQLPNYYRHDCVVGK